ncbi:hypothetical protein C8P68_105192 [Mucilaginibacter yixingensis]|uniref:Transmembrane family 220 protein n=1 Tax=Mucilaginibacter yixingensis TaxID=1295612 RepID=A0A2T5J899_9SPHI|nr:hypothetical protein [Mucilaginibacter yixingensis]PTQ95685.1 hypothetical protein C8P68_105192 [Mucilaginibacter yixingensis]
MINLRLCFLLSLFGLAMALATISFIPTQTEWMFWLPIFLVCAIIIARRAPGKYFWHGMITCLLNCVWITGLHLSFFDTYTAHHPDMAAMQPKSGYFAVHPRQMMLMVGPFVGIASGIILGLFSVIAGAIFKSKKAAA